MRRYLKGDKVEVLNTRGALEDSWHPALIVDGDGDVYIVLYDGHVNGVVEECMLAKYIRPRPPVVEFSNWSRGDLVHVFDNFAWKLATVLHVSKMKQFLVRVVGSMLDLNVEAGCIRVRHYWQGDQWVLVGKGSSNSDAKQPRLRCNMVSDSKSRPMITGVRRSTRQKSSNLPTKAIKRTLVSTVNQPEGRLTKISRTIERTSPSTLNQIEGCCCTGIGNSGMILRFTERKSLIHPPTATANLRMPQHEKHQDSGLSSSSSCSINSSTSADHCTTKSTKQQHCDDDVSDAESCTWASEFSKKKVDTKLHNRPAPQRCGLILRIRLQDTSPRGLLL